MKGGQLPRPNGTRWWAVFQIFFQFTQFPHIEMPWRGGQLTHADGLFSKFWCLEALRQSFDFKNAHFRMHTFSFRINQFPHNFFQIRIQTRFASVVKDISMSSVRIHLSHLVLVMIPIHPIHKFSSSRENLLSFRSVSVQVMVLQVHLNTHMLFLLSQIPLNFF